MMQGLSSSLSWSIPFSSPKFRVKASWDTQQRLPYNRNAPRKLTQPPKPQSPSPAPSTRKENYISDLLKRATPLPTIGKIEEHDETYLGYERWLPTPPKVVKPRSVFNAATLAYIGDCIYEVTFFTILFLIPIYYSLIICSK